MNSETTFSLEPLLSELEISDRIKQLADEIKADYGDEDLVFIAILKGSIFFLADLIRYFSPQATLDFLQVSSYAGNLQTSGVVQIRKDLDQSIEGKKVLIVEDIVDTGLTLSHLIDLLSTRKPADLRVVSLLSKRLAKGLTIPINYTGFEIADKFVVGYGLDFKEQFRNLPYISILRYS